MDARPDLTAALEHLLVEMVEHAPPLHRVDVGVVVVVGVSAHGLAAASVRELAPCARSVVVNGTRRSIELALRPPFFLGGDAPARLATLAHELLHLDGKAVRADNMHDKKSHAALEKEARAVAKTLLPRLEPRALLCLAHHGEVMLRAWKHRPTETTKRRSFDDDDVYAQPLMLMTPADRRGGWW
ncbi:MAG: hypothetical protein Q8O67_01125 [Deltaproteobacteria bacterium]|nr:hypothetical protein [Deltaproteobacteria bacterium]